MYPTYNQGYNQNPNYNQNYQPNQGGFNQGYPQNYYSNTMDPSYQNYQNYGNQVNQQVNQGNTLYIPDELEMTEKLLTIGMDMYIESQGRKIGMLTQRFKQWHCFQISDESGRVLLTARGKMWELGNDFQVFDANGTLLGHITQQLIKSLFTFGQIFTVYDANNNKVGTTKQTQIVRTHVDVQNNMNSIEANMTKTAFFKDKWKIKFNGNSIDRRLLIFFPAFISLKQDQRQTNNRINGWEFKF